MAYFKDSACFELVAPQALNLMKKRKKMEKHNRHYTFKATERDEELIESLSKLTGESASEIFRSSAKFKALLYKMLRTPDVLLRIYDIYEESKKEFMQ